MINNELKEIKKLYGEKMMQLCREFFPTILDTPFLLLNILKNNIFPTRSLANDIISNNQEDSFKNFINSFIEKKDELVDTTKNPFELLKEAGYELYECNNELEIQKFRKYYIKGEELCTFTTGNRLDRCYVFFAVKDNVLDIKREKFYKPEREDEYGVSVISIQFSRGIGHVLSIKNRYNHTVYNPDATFNNNLENIIPGLTKSFEDYLGFEITQDINDIARFLRRYNYVLANDGKYYRFNYEINGIYYCENNIIIDNGVVIKKYYNEKERYILADYFILDKKLNTISLYDSKVKDSFYNTINDLGKIKNITSTKGKEITIEYVDGKLIKLSLNSNNVITSYENNYVEKIGNNFLYLNRMINDIKLPNVLEIGDDFLKQNEDLTLINFPKVKSVGSWFLNNNNSLISVNLSELVSVGICFLNRNNLLEVINLPKLENIGSCFLFSNSLIKNIYLPNVKRIDEWFLPFNNSLLNVVLPKVKVIGGNFLSRCESLQNIYIPEVEEISSLFLCSDNNLESIYLPKLKSVGIYFLKNNTKLNSLYAPCLANIGFGFFQKNPYINNKEIEKGKIYIKS